MRRDDLFNKREALVLASLDEPFRMSFRIAAIAVNDALADNPYGDLRLYIEDGWRSHESQEELFKKGREEVGSSDVWKRAKNVRGKLLPIVTNARGGWSPHNYRRAAHLVLRYTTPDAKTKQLEWMAGSDPRWILIKEKVELQGLKSGYDFKSPFDPAHVESKDWRALAEIRAYVSMKPDERMDKWQHKP